VDRPIPNNQINLLQNGEAYFAAIEAAFEHAEQEIYLESYIFKADDTGWRIAKALRGAALRGVKTHLLIDGFGSHGLPKSMIDYIESAGVMLLIFRPKISPWTLRRRRLRRLHRKIVIIDRTIAFVGGINIRDDMDDPGQTSPRYDYAVSVYGPLVEEIYESTRKLWSRAAWARLRPGWILVQNQQHRLAETNGGMRAALVVRDNIRHRRDIENAYLHAIDHAKREIILANAYFLPGLNVRHALINAAGRGVQIVLLLQGTADHRLLQYASRALYGTFLQNGIVIYEYRKSLMHAKVAVIDGHWSTVGSSNLDPFSLLLSLEANVVVDDEKFARTLKNSLQQAIQSGAQRILQNTWKTQPLRLRLVSWLSYGFVRFLTGIAGYAPGNSPVMVRRARSHL
jgi:cardiolipin synthase